ncbi:MAG: chromosomal replication initiator protein DnaA [Caldithrix sp. RBG_13_44_9]|nr:MAG: chromosomal replication initiator protein DnaA [Caldithrix sp. RBG_13_44_9]
MARTVAHPVSDHLPAETGIQAKWNQCLKILKEEISPQGYQTWLSPLIPVNYVENTLILRVPSQFFFEWIESHYQQNLLKTVKKIFGAASRIEYLVASSGDKKPEELHLGDDEPAVEPPDGQSFSPGIDNRYQFDNFFVKNDNELALRAAQTVAKQPGKTDFNPLFIYGDSGCGKTHLLHAIGNNILLNKKRKKISFLSSENFLNQYINALQNKQVESFNKKFEQTDVLLIDDIQFLANKKKSQEGLFYFFSEFERQHKQIVITANQPPSQLTELDQRLLSFFQKGLIIDLITPGYETRLKFIQSYCQKTHLSILTEVKEFLANSLSEGMQEIRAVMIRIAAQTSLLGKPVPLAATKKLLSHIDAKWASKNGNFRLRHQIKVDEIIKIVSEYLNMPADVLIGHSRQREVTFARQVAIYLAKELCGESLQVIGYHFNDRHYTAILHNYKRIRSEMKNNPAIYHLIMEIRNQLVNS